MHSLYGDRRIQVFDGEGKCLRQITIDAPFDYAAAVPAIGNKPAANATGAQISSSSSAALTALPVLSSVSASWKRPRVPPRHRRWEHHERRTRPHQIVEARFIARFAESQAW